MTVSDIYKIWLNVLCLRSLLFTFTDLDGIIFVNKAYLQILKKFFYTIVFLILSFFTMKGQVTGFERFVQLSGMITDELYIPVQGVTVVSMKLHKGSVSGRTGIYSITTTPGDTVFFRALGYKRYYTIIPGDYKDKTCKFDLVLQPDTLAISEVKIFPWKNYPEFIKEMTRTIPVDPKIENMNDNIASIYVAIANQNGVSISAEAGYRYAMEQNFSSMSTRNQMPVNNLLNPFAWTKFVREIKNGLLRNHSFKKPEPAKVLKKKKKRDK